ncbi:MucR family transcriptional regulator [Methylobacterium sp. NFXW15]|uniref:MucR family transcriptional regulator n=1 Tax=Methylobacterium sp. NFXW15 TaxID=2819512 RepID=UPI003CEBD3BA
MSQETEGQRLDFIVAASDIVAAYVSNNHVAAADLPALIITIHQALGTLANGAPAPEEEAVEKPSAAQVRKSVQQDAIISFIDGRRYKTLKRHLAAHGFNPASYREKFGLGADYPMVAPAYSEKRSNLAKSLGLGRPAEQPSPRSKAA